MTNQEWIDLIDEKEDELKRVILDAYIESFDLGYDVRIILNKHGKVYRIVVPSTTNELEKGDAIEICTIESNIYYDDSTTDEDYLYYIRDKNLQSQYEQYVKEHNLDVETAGYDFVESINKLNDFDDWLRETYIDDFKCSKLVDLIIEAGDRLLDYDE